MKETKRKTKSQKNLIKFKWEKISVKEIMIRNIKIRNFKGIAKEFELSFLAEKRRDRNGDQKVRIAKEDILTVVALFGKNGSGKSSTLDAFDFVATIGDQYSSALSHLQDRQQKNKSTNGEYITIESKEVYELIYLRHANQSDEPIEVTYSFYIENDIYNHSIKYNKSGIIEELLEKNGQTIFQETSLINERRNPFISLGLEQQAVKLLTLEKFLVDKFPYVRFQEFKQYYNKDKFHYLLLSWIQLADEKIVDIIIDDEYDFEAVKIDFFGRVQRLALFKLSSGTIKWVNVFRSVISALLWKNSILLLDEIDSRWHNALTDFIQQLFMDSNINKMNSQLLFTSHNSSIIRSTFRKDAINLIENGKIVNLGKEYGLRNDFVFSKNYLSETLGDHPSVDSKIEFLNILESDE